MGGRVRSRSWRGRSREVGVLYQVKKYFYYFTLLYPRELYPLPGIQFSGSVRVRAPELRAFIHKITIYHNYAIHTIHGSM